MKPSRRDSAQDRCPGALDLHEAADGFLARVRIPGGYLHPAALRALAGAAADLGDGNLDLTSRGNVQLRGLAAHTGTALAARLSGAGLLPSVTHERVRNIVASLPFDELPFDELHPNELPPDELPPKELPPDELPPNELHPNELPPDRLSPGAQPPGRLPPAGGVRAADVRALVSELDRLLCADPLLAGLSGRFLFTVDDGTGDVSGLDGDVGLVRVDAETVALCLAGVDTGLRTVPAHAAATATAVARAFLHLREARGGNAWRLSELDSSEQHACAAEAASAGGMWRTEIPLPRPVGGYRPPLGKRRRPDGLFDVGVAAPLGRLDQNQIALLVNRSQPAAGTHPLCASSSATTPDTGTTPGTVSDISTVSDIGTISGTGTTPDGGELRITAWRTVHVTGVGADTVDGLLATLAAAGFTVDDDAPMARVSACTGRPGCAKSLADVRAEALRTAALLTAGPRLAVHWSGCARDCGRPAERHVRVRATGAGYDVIRDGATVSTVDFSAGPAGLAKAVEEARRR